VPRWQPQYCGPFEIHERIGPVAYQLAMTLTMKFHDICYVSLLKKYFQDVDGVID